jgi:hypothetical protein
MSSHGGKLFLHICKLEWFKSKQCEQMKMYLFVHKKPYRAGNSDSDLATLFFVKEKFSLTPRWRLGPVVIKKMMSPCSF